MPQQPAQRFVVDEGRIGRVLTALMALGFLALMLAGGAAAWVASRGQQHDAWVTHTYEVELGIADVRRLIEQGETTRRGLLLSPGTGDFLQSYRAAAAALPPALGKLASLTEDSAAQQAAVGRLHALIDPLVADREASVRQVLAGDAAGAGAAFASERSAARLGAIRTLFDAMTANERRLLAQRDATRQQGVRTFYALLGGAGVLLAAVVLVSTLVVARSTREIGRSRDRLRGFNEALEEQVGERTADLSRANEEIQRFAYIVSHDLRSPLVNVMGFTAELESAAGEVAALIDRAEAQAPEIVTEEARLAAREDLPEAIGFIRTSTQKMDRLINAILALSRQGRRVLAPEPVDVAALVDGIGASLAHVMDDREATLTIEGELPNIVTDRLAIEQIFSNLIENATKYRQPGRPGRVVVRGARDGARVRFEVSDNGRGIDPRDHDRVFDLFRRSGAQDQPGEGIGLANVRALAYRLGGMIDLRSTLGEGATFGLVLPVMFTATEAPSR